MGGMEGARTARGCTKSTHLRLHAPENRGCMHCSITVQEARFIRKGFNRRSEKHRVEKRQEDTRQGQRLRLNTEHSPA